MRVLIIDNYDSFTFNLYQYIGEILTDSTHGVNSDNEILVKRNDQIDIKGIREINPDRIVISPGTGTPEDEQYFGVCHDVILKLGKTIPLMGVCLGMQGIAHSFGGRVLHAPVPMHGKISSIQHDERGIFNTIPQGLKVMRYHSLMVETSSLPDCLEITSVVNGRDESFLSLEKAAEKGNEIMGVRHKVYPIHGIQFHPESFATEGAKEMLCNFLN